ncbi:MAG: SUF system NifU family Fe-S cluster assembly protein [Alphaproteobacteria bacterium]|nr:SUF system NifU family Fe-S cluster assembly protein [Alphaproteobacteria bacterium]
MSDSLKELYQEIILDHARHPRHAGVLADANAEAEGYNPLCGDRVKIYARLKDGRIAGLTFEGKGCAISQASASLMVEMLQGRTIEEAESLRDAFLHLVKGHEHTGMSEDDRERLEVMAGVQQFPMRVKCATLAWHTLHEAVTGGHETVSSQDETP